jgi:hypothetical protein
MHVNALDVCLQIHRIQYQDDMRIRVKAQWVNLGYMGEPWYLTGMETITIPRSQITNWKYIDPFVKRTKEGLPSAK